MVLNVNKVGGESSVARKVDGKISISDIYETKDNIRFYLKPNYKDPEIPSIYVITTGGTIAHKRNEKGHLCPYENGNKDLISLMLNHYSDITNIANIDFADFGNIDSTEMVTTHRNWNNEWREDKNRPKTRVEIAQEIFYDLDKYDGFVITHGTDTMAYTSAALSLMLRDLGKPVILTGAQRSAFEAPSDGIANIGWSLKCAVDDFAGVYIAFGDRLINGSRATKIDENGNNAFDSPRAVPAAQFGANLRLSPNRKTRHENVDTILFADLSSQVVYLPLTSGIDERIFNLIVESEYVDGIVLGAFGAGNVQNYLIPCVEKATGMGKPIVIATNCQLGTTEPIYDAGNKVLEAGGISAGDMTIEMAWLKTMYSIGRINNEPERSKLKGKPRVDAIGRLVRTPIADEITV